MATVTKPKRKAVNEGLTSSGVLAIAAREFGTCILEYKQLDDRERRH
jgi:hypothetical protein